MTTTKRAAAEIVEQSKQYSDDVIGLLTFNIIDGKLTRDTERMG